MEVVDYIFSKIGTLLFMCILGIEVFYYFIYPMVTEARKQRKEDNDKQEDSE